MAQQMMSESRLIIFLICLFVATTHLFCLYTSQQMLANLRNEKRIKKWNLWYWADVLQQQTPRVRVGKDSCDITSTHWLLKLASDLFSQREMQHSHSPKLQIFQIKSIRIPLWSSPELNAQHILCVAPRSLKLQHCSDWSLDTKWQS